MAHIVPVPDERDLPALERAKFLLDGEQVSERLAGVRRVGKTVDDRNRGGMRHDDQVLVPIDPRHDDVPVPGEASRLVLQRPEGEVAGLPVHEDRVAPELGHPHLEAEPRAGARLLEEHDETLPGEGLCILAWRAFDGGRKVEDGEELLRGEVLQGEEMPCHHPDFRRRNIKSYAMSTVPPRDWPGMPVSKRARTAPLFPCAAVTTPLSGLPEGVFHVTPLPMSDWAFSFEETPLGWMTIWKVFWARLPLREFA